MSNASPPSGLSFAGLVPYYSGGNGANAAAIADVNGDGFPGLVKTNWCSNSNCTGGAVGYTSRGLFAHSVAIADENGDGKPDAVAAVAYSLDRTVPPQRPFRMSTGTANPI